MNFLKSVFISGYMMLLVGGSLYGSWLVSQETSLLLGWGLMMTTSR